MSEAHFILANLAGRLDKPRSTTVCGGVSTGVLMGQPVVVITTGAREYPSIRGSSVFLGIEGPGCEAIRVRVVVDMISVMLSVD